MKITLDLLDWKTPPKMQIDWWIKWSDIPWMATALWYHVAFIIAFITTAASIGSSDEDKKELAHQLCKHVNEVSWEVTYKMISTFIKEFDITKFTK